MENNNLYQKNDHHFKMLKERQKDEAKKAIDKILKSYQNAVDNGLQMDKDYENIGAIRRFYNKHYLINYLLSLGLLALVASGLSFFSKFVILAIPLGLILYFVFSKELYLFFLFYTHKVDKKIKKDISRYIFGKSDFGIFVIFCSMLFALTFTALHFTKAIFLTKFEDTKFIQLITRNFQSFDINNELFSYSILLSFIILLFFKIIKK